MIGWSVWSGHALRAATVVAVIAACAPLSAAFSQGDLSKPTFIERACRLPNVTPKILPRLRCGTVEVPRDYENHAAGHFKLAVVVVRSAQQPSLPAPVVYISGGPGDPLTIYAGYQALHLYAPGRDLILVDQRGTGRSEPHLCPGFATKLLDADLAVAADASEGHLAQRRAMYLACRDAAEASGIHLENFGTTVTAEDFEWVRRALGIRQWNVYGESYGTTVAMTLVAKHPGTVRSVVLDSVYPPDPMPPRSTIEAAAREAFFGYCAHDPDCAAAFPNLAQTYAETLDRLHATPLPVTVPPRLRQPGNIINLTPALFQRIVANLMYYPRNYPGLPRLIAAMHRGDTKSLGPVIAALVSEAAKLDWADDAAVECRDRPSLRAPLAKDASSEDEVQWFGVCAEWSRLGPPPVIPAGTTVPTLVLAGEFDPVAGLALSRQVAEEIGTHAHWVEFPRLGHNVRFFSPCAAQIVAHFIGHPNASLDTACVTRRPQIAFLSPFQRD